jgi:hypothetical protein
MVWCFVKHRDSFTYQSVFTAIRSRKQNDQLKKVKAKSLYKLKMYICIYISNTYKDCDLLHDKSVLWSGGRPTTKPQLSYDCNQNLVMSPTGAQRSDGLIDCQLQRDSDSDSH